MAGIPSIVAVTGLVVLARVELAETEPVGTDGVAASSPER